ncbi:Hypothetical_protein [Hexamita inflata]|uniref:Hypothetical_protein n=1 Tax=Hexamita inflata TaxID=28002 RepID=A0AA86R044_9EUKA|nr:Hypothetical protein HINF_LOCUS24168 [Hexamita inflata]CAI9936527.1 Hypothetical protein HINF_LOCUS24172 [Hexamita inflata]CAI9936530.1 Hypothetical protein HINF_LOCUS24175 [Hexamita inflata]CAI9967148.1 Hypothetical protein HINF_LOCUS54793 [Hexamita inflata]
MKVKIFQKIVYIVFLLPPATDLAELHLRKLDATKNEKRNRMNPSSITLNKASIPVSSALTLDVELYCSKIIYKYDLRDDQIQTYYWRQASAQESHYICGNL